MCTVKIRYKDKVASCRFFIVPRDSPVLLGIPDIELLDILKVICDVTEGQQADRKFDSQTIESSSTLSNKVNTDIEGRSYNVDVINSNSNMQNYFRSRINRDPQLL